MTRPSRIASDLLCDQEDPEAVARLIVDAIRPVYEHPGTFTDPLAVHAQRFGLRGDDGLGLLRWLLALVGDPDTDRWLEAAKAHVARRTEAQPRRTPQPRRTEREVPTTRYRDLDDLVAIVSGATIDAETHPRMAMASALERRQTWGVVVDTLTSPARSRMGRWP